MISVQIEMSANTGQGDPVLDIAGWIAAAMTESPIDGMMIHSIRIEQEDA